jgi:outer membrane protein assembly factor BamB
MFWKKGVSALNPRILLCFLAAFAAAACSNAKSESSGGGGSGASNPGAPSSGAPEGSSSGATNPPPSGSSGSATPASAGGSGSESPPSGSGEAPPGGEADADATEAGGGGASSGAPGVPRAGVPPIPAGFHVLTNRYDNARSGSNPHETTLTTTNVNRAMFGLKYTAPVTGRVYGHPLYVSGLMVKGATHNTVFVGTEHNMVYAFDADSGAPLWSKALEPSWIPGQDGFAPGCHDMGGLEVGITGTPVISLEDGAIYAAAKTMGKYVLHALDLATGNDLPKSPVTIIPPPPADATWSSALQLNRPGLLHVNGVVYVAFGSHCDHKPYHGWVFGFDAVSLALKYTFNTTPNSGGGAIWMSGTGPSSDGQSIWFACGNEAPIAVPTDPADMSMSAVKTDLTLKLLTHHMEPVRGDNDLVTGVILVGDQALIGGKSGQVTLINTKDASMVQTVTAGGETHNIATWAGPSGTMVYTCDTGASLHSWQITGGMLADKGGNPAISTAHPGGMITTSSNGTMPGTGIVWVSAPTGANAWGGTSPGKLSALNAADITKPVLWDSSMTAGEAVATWAKFSPPIVAAGKVFLATFDDKLMVYGLK